MVRAPSNEESCRLLRADLRRDLDCVAGISEAGSARRRGFFATGGLVFLLGVFAPALVALGLTWHDEGRDGVVALLARIGRWSVEPRWYLIALGYMAAIKLLAAVFARFHRDLAGFR